MQALMPHAAAYGIEQRAPAGGDRRLPDGPGADALPRLRRPAALLPPGGRRRRRGRGQHLRPHRARRPSTTRTSWAWRCSSPTSSATSATTRGAAASTCRWTSCSSSTSRRTRSCKRSAWGYSDRFTALMRFQAERAHAHLRRGAGAAARCRPARAEAGADDGQHLPHAAARDRADGFQVLHQRIVADAAAQALDRHAHATGAAVDVTATRAASPWSAPAGPAWPPRCEATRRSATASRCSRWRAHAGGRARSVGDAARRRRSTTASTS